MLTSSLLVRRNAILHLLAFLVAMATRGWIAFALDPGKCQTALGMQTGDILDSALSASSSMDPSSMGPGSARIRLELKGGAWCPEGQISKDSYEFLEIDLRALHVITLVETQGRFGNGQGQEYTEQFRLEYQRETDGKWFRFRNRRGQEIIQGNMNTHTAEMRELHPPIIAQKIRFVPHSSHPKTVCLRVELYGCLWQDGVISYDVTQGEQRGIDLNFVDDIYDGSDENGYLSGGLGQLFDGEEGQTNFRLDLHGLGRKGYEWIGWRNDSFTNGFLELIFKFKGIRNFTSISLHCNNMFTRDVRVFSVAQVYFSGMRSVERIFNPTALEFTYVRDSFIEYARTVTIPLENNTGKFVKVLLYFDARWMMISEVQFISELITVNDEGDQLHSPSRSGEDLQTVADDDDVLLHTKRMLISRTSTNRLIANLSAFETITSESIPHLNNIASDVTLMESVTSWNISRTQNRSRSGIDDESVVILITVLVVVVLTLCAIIIIIAFKSTKNSCFHHRFPSDTKTSKPSPSVGGDGSDSSYGPPLITFSQTSGLLQRNAPGPSSYLIPACHQESDEQDQCDTTSPLISAPLCASPYATVDILNIFDIQNCEQAGRFCTVPRNMNRSYSSWTDIPRESLKFLRHLGEALTGEVYLCELMQRMNSQQLNTHCSAQTLTSRLSPRSTLVAVKVVSKNAGDQSREDFQREAAAMSALENPNIVRLLGVCTNSDPCYFVLEYPQHGNLKEFLQNCTMEGTVKHNSKNTLSYGSLIYMASQIASGMKFLESNNLVHRDLAARNCLVGDDYIVKISDFGNGHSLYPTDYYKSPDTAPLPIRWMAWEALRLSNFSTKSDVWSFAVTVWEMLTFALQPYEVLSDEQVIVNSNHLLQNPGLWVALEQPVLCPREIYDLLSHCWSRDKSQRPTFHEVHMFLQKKNAGYHPYRDKGSKTIGRSNASASLFV